MTLLQGGCACKAVRYEWAETTPEAAVHCQCRPCQHATGAGHASFFMVKAKDFSLRGTLSWYDQPMEDGKTVMRRGFCPTCGSPLLSKPSSMPEVVIVHAATLDDPSRFTPQRVVNHAQAQPWDHVDPALPQVP